MSEAELHTLQCRMHQGRLNKARRGELFTLAPSGYRRSPGGELMLDPDEQVQSVIRLIFDQFDRLGSLHGVLRHLVRNGIRPNVGPGRGGLEWRRPNKATLSHVLQHPLYAGAYRYGHRHSDPRRRVPGRPDVGRRIMSAEDCQGLIRGRCPAYISWEQFEANQRRLAANRARSDATGAPRPGTALLGGLVICGRCCRRVMVAYRGRDGRGRYYCRGVDLAEPLCQSLFIRELDAIVARQVLAVLEPAALEASLAITEDLQEERRRLDQHWQQRRERARYEADRAERQYQAVEPENRLVARELERRWELTLCEGRELDEEYDRWRQLRPAEMPPRIGRRSWPWPPTCRHCGTRRRPPRSNGSRSCGICSTG
jgi:hypothetical protein